jgi:ATP-binding cassette subfamily C exporter for protease/lipase
MNNTPPISQQQRSELIASLGRLKREFVVVGLFSMVVNLMMLAPSLYMLQVFDRVMSSQNEFTLIALSLITLFFFIIMAFGEWARSRLLVRMGTRMDEMLSSRVFGATFEARLNKADQTSAKSFSDFTNIRQFLTGNGIIAFFDAPWTPIYLLVLFLLHPLLGGVSLAGALLLSLMARLTDCLTMQPLESAQEAGAQANIYLHSKLRNAEVVESMGMLDDLRRRWLTRHQHYLRLNSRAHDLGHRIQALTKFIRYTLQSLILGAGAILVIEGKLSPGAMVAASILMGRALAPVELAIATWRGFSSARASFKRLQALFAEHPERHAGTFHGTPTGRMTLQDVTALAPGRPQPILQGLNLDFPAGQIIGIIGPSGSGKSTLARVLLGIWPNVAGQVLLDGEPLSGWSRRELGPYLGYLPQDVQLFEGTVAANIARFGAIDSGKVIKAAQMAGVHDMVLRLPNGYETPVGEVGSYLSGGQRQRIALARAIYGDPSLIVLDEPNSNLDDVGERALIQAILGLRTQGKAVILITHRYNILGVTDRILVLHQGTVQMYGARQDVLSALTPPAPQRQSAV